MQKFEQFPNNIPPETFKGILPFGQLSKNKEVNEGVKMRKSEFLPWFPSTFRGVMPYGIYSAEQRALFWGLQANEPTQFKHNPATGHGITPVLDFTKMCPITLGAQFLGR